MSLRGNGNRVTLSGGAVLGTVVALIAFAVVVLWIALHGNIDSRSTPLVATVLGLVATTVPSVLALLKVDGVRSDIRNGVLKNKVIDALHETGVTDAVAEGKQTTPAALSALNMLLAKMAADENTALHTKEKDDG